MDEPIILSGKLNVNFCYHIKNKIKTLPVIKNSAHQTMGRDWLKMLNFLMNMIHAYDVSFKSNTFFEIS